MEMMIGWRSSSSRELHEHPFLTVLSLHCSLCHSYDHTCTRDDMFQYTFMSTSHAISFVPSNRDAEAQNRTASAAAVHTRSISSTSLTMLRARSRPNQTR